MFPEHKPKTKRTEGVEEEDNGESRAPFGLRLQDSLDVFEAPFRALWCIWIHTITIGTTIGSVHTTSDVVLLIFGDWYIDQRHRIRDTCNKDYGENKTRH